MKKSIATTKKSRGPNTEKGKLISSQNAIKSGLTTRQLLNQPELKRYNQLVKDLTAHYATSNPLVPLQIERIARMQIQLERIQNAIDLLYRKAELNPSERTSKHPEINRLAFNLKIKILAKKLDASVLDKIQKGLIISKLVQYIENRSKVTFKSSSEEESAGPVISQKSLLGCYLYAEADFYKQDIDEYLKEKKLSASNSPYGKDLYKSMNIEVLLKAMEMVKSPDLSQSIATENEYEYRVFENWFENGLAIIPEYVEELRKLLDPNQDLMDVALPNFDELDRLIRYQTTLSRQLSTAIGELIVLNR